MTELAGRLLTSLLALQDDDGRFRWVPGGLYDPWNQAECVMALLVSGEKDAAWRGLAAIPQDQDEDGALPGDMGCAVAMTEDGERLDTSAPLWVRDTNFAAWPALAVWMAHHVLAERPVLSQHAPWALKALRFAISHQRADGTIPWHVDARGRPSDDKALLAANAAIYKALDAGIAIARTCDLPRDDLRSARARLGVAMASGDGLFADKSDYAMDWYYPVLAQAIDGAQARSRIRDGWSRFVVEGHGCRCVAQEPWTTAAETAELVMACLSCGLTREADTLLAGFDRYWNDDLNGAAMGYQVAEQRHWPQDAPSWTQAAMLLALAARDGHPAARLLVDSLRLRA